MKKDIPAKNPNPQGKGLSSAVGLLTETVAAMAVPPLEDDSCDRIVEDYLCSLLVLSCSFSFRPVADREYFIYFHDSRLLLSLISPAEGGMDIYDEYWAACRLKNDFCWSVQLSSEDLKERLTNSFPANVPEKERLEYFFSGVQRGEIGRYDKKLGYYQNVLNYALGKSIGLRSKRLLELEESSTGHTNKRKLPGSTI
ncbi:hypothetical protein [Desulfopila sp. IMCC35008]|uniref:hypothetical protein n=1 Tax=Desulfopila sp. IMCC35008 TaxID=2653858 RepID=UPI0013CFE55B|nr:hypothetical protein [Desulfopila sp. IMCC35008]